MPRDKNPKIDTTARGRYNRKITDPSSGHTVWIGYTACLVDSEDIELEYCTDRISPASVDWMKICQDRINQKDSPLRIELAEWADYKESHRCH